MTELLKKKMNLEERAAGPDAHGAVGRRGARGARVALPQRLRPRHRRPDLLGADI